MEPIKLPSGRELRITLATFAEAKALYQAILEEARQVQLDKDKEIDTNLIKELFCLGFSSKKIELALEACFKRCTYNGLKIDKDSFEEVEARQDYFLVCYEVAWANIEPFLKALLPKLNQVLATFNPSQQ